MWLMLLGCRDKVFFDTPIPPDHPWERADPSDAWQTRFDAAWAYHREVGGLAMLAVQGEALVYERYAEGVEDSTPWPYWSGTKTFACAMAMAAVDQGWLALDEKVGATLELALEQQAMTVRHLLQFTSGVQNAYWKLNVDSLYSAETQRVDDKYAVALSQPQEHPPGEVFDYSPVHHLIFGALLEAKLNEDTLAWFERSVLTPIGFRYAGWQRDPSDNLLIHLGVWSTAAEWLRFGVLLRDDGAWEGDQVLPAGTLAACGQGSDANPAYGLSAWLNQEVPDSVEIDLGVELEEDGPLLYAGGYTDLVAAAGASGQRAYIVPSEDLVVVILSDSRDFADPVFLSELLP